ncbi:MAG: hypothetical protein E7497_06335 [Ruminococcus sp.]|nr:hypothetical protein [Ruminococcus sp.]
MFGRNDDNDDIYNSQEYDNGGDYIRPSEEYRADCGTEHGMTYENHDNEQHAYDNHNNAEAEFTSTLMLDEHILWAGESKQKIGLAGGCASAPVLFFSFFWLGFAIFWTIGATAAGGVFGLFGLPFVAVGIFLLVQSLNVGKKFYAITNKRVLRKERGHLTAHSLMDIHDVQMMKTSGNTGHISFASSNTRGTRYRVNGRYVEMPVSLVGIENPEEVYRILNEAVYMASSTT